MTIRTIALSAAAAAAGVTAVLGCLMLGLYFGS